MKATPDPALLALPEGTRPDNAPFLLDASLYRGNYYLYVGVVPAVTPFFRCAVFTGNDMPDGLAALIFCGGRFRLRRVVGVRCYLSRSLGYRIGGERAHGGSAGRSAYVGDQAGIMLRAGVGGSEARKTAVQRSSHFGHKMELHPIKPGDVSLGHNPLRISSSREVFGGLLYSVRIGQLVGN